MKSFETLGLSRGLAEAIKQIGFETPTPIQEKAIPILLQGDRDFVGLAQTGTGKTAAFGLPLLELIDERSRDTQALILAPTRELGLQITSDLDGFLKNYKSINVVAVYGGSSISEQIKKVKKGAQIIVATPGRLIDLITRKAIHLETIRYVILDEADEMLNMGFKDDLDQILSYTPDEKNTWLFSATMPKEVKNISKNYMSNPVELTIGEKNQGNVNIEHRFVLVQEKEKYPALKRILDFHPEIFCIIFCRTKSDTQKVAEMLIKDGYNADALHGDLTQQQRDKVMKKFRQRSLQILVATDVAARGIDVDDITHVVHFNIPDEIEFYTHRSGRTARAGKKGISIAMITKKEMGKIKQIERIVNLHFRRLMIPTGQEVCHQQLLALMHRVHTVKVNEEEISEFLPEVYHELKDLSKEELIKRFASIEFNRFLEYYRDAEDLNKVQEDSQKGSTERYVTGNRVFINVGKMDGLDKAGMLELIDSCCNVEKKSIGKIELKGAYSFFEIDKDRTDDILNGFDGATFRGRTIRVELTSAKEQSLRKGKSSHNRKSGFAGRGNSKRRNRQRVGY